MRKTSDRGTTACNVNWEFNSLMTFLQGSNLIGVSENVYSDLGHNWAPFIKIVSLK